jgi:hypothetical protein
LEEVCAYFGLEVRTLRARVRNDPACRCSAHSHCHCGRSPRSRPYTEARFLLCYLLHEDLAMSNLRIGLLIARDHSTVIHNVKRARLLLEQRSDFRWHLEQLRAALYSVGLLYGERAPPQS